MWPRRARGRGLLLLKRKTGAVGGGPGNLTSRSAAGARRHGDLFSVRSTVSAAPAALAAWSAPAASIASAALAAHEYAGVVTPLLAESERRPCFCVN